MRRHGARLSAAGADGQPRRRRARFVRTNHICLGVNSKCLEYNRIGDKDQTKETWRERLRVQARNRAVTCTGHRSDQCRRLCTASCVQRNDLQGDSQGLSGRQHVRR